MDKLVKYASSSVLVRLVASIFLFIAVADLPFGYYKFMRLVVFLSAIYTCYISYIKSAKINFGVWSFGLIAILFNPVFPFYFGRSGWKTTDVIVGLIFVVSTFIIREDDSKE